jgi:tetrahydromethanopterin S-methyltransferase subunit B
MAKVSETMKTQVALIKKDVEYLKKSMDRLEEVVNEVKKNTEEHFVTKSEFQPVRMIVYGLVGLILTAVAGSLIGLVIIK